MDKVRMSDVLELAKYLLIIEKIEPEEGGLDKEALTLANTGLLNYLKDRGLIQKIPQQYQEQESIILKYQEQVVLAYSLSVTYTEQLNEEKTTKTEENEVKTVGQTLHNFLQFSLKALVVNGTMSASDFLQFPMSSFGSYCWLLNSATSEDHEFQNVKGNYSLEVEVDEEEEALLLAE